MAQVSVDISEFDALRDAKNKAEAENARLTKEIDSVKGDLRTIVITKTIIPSAAEIEKTVRETLTSVAAQHLYWGGGYNPGVRSIRSAYDSSFQREAVRSIVEAIESSWSARSTLESVCRKLTEKLRDCAAATGTSRQFINFDDAMMKASAHYDEQFRAEWEAKMNEVSRMKIELEKAREKLAESLRGEFEQTQNSLKMQLDREKGRIIKEYEEKIEKLEDEIKSLKDAASKKQQEEITKARAEEYAKMISCIVKLKDEIYRLRHRCLLSRLLNL